MGTSVSRLCDCFIANKYQEIGESEWDKEDKPTLHSSVSIVKHQEKEKDNREKENKEKESEKGKSSTNSTNGANGTHGTNGSSGANGNGGGTSRRGSANSIASIASIASNGSTGKTEAIEIRNPNSINSASNLMGAPVQEMTKTIFFAKYDLRDEIGLGSTSKCYKCVRRSDGK